MYLSVVGQPIDAFKGKALEFADAYKSEYLNGKPIDPYAIYGAQAADTVLTAIESSDGSRGDVIKQMFAYQSDDSLLGPISFNEEGDIVGQGAYGITIYVATTKLETEKVINPKQETVNAALGK
jgi:ABC-type branched-subunit amino acid transport system substrate-binding protein